MTMLCAGGGGGGGGGVGGGSAVGVGLAVVEEEEGAPLMGVAELLGEVKPRPHYLDWSPERRRAHVLVCMDTLKGRMATFAELRGLTGFDATTLHNALKALASPKLDYVSKDHDTGHWYRRPKAYEAPPHGDRRHAARQARRAEEEEEERSSPGRGRLSLSLHHHQEVLVLVPVVVVVAATSAPCPSCGQRSRWWWPRQ